MDKHRRQGKPCQIIMQQESRIKAQLNLSKLVEEFSSYCVDKDTILQLLS